MKNLFLVIVLVPLFLVSCGKTEEVKTMVDTQIIKQELGIKNQGNIDESGSKKIEGTAEIETYRSKVEKIEGADFTTFEVMKDGYSRDKNNIYYVSLRKDFGKIKNVSAKSFELITNNGVTFGKDQNWVYVAGEKLEGADPKTFTYYNGFAKDKNSIYLLQNFEGNRFFNVNKGDELIKYQAIDKDSFENLGESYYRDKNNVYYIATYNIIDSPGIIKGADPKTFQVLSAGIAKDKTHNYLKGILTK